MAFAFALVVDTSLAEGAELTDAELDQITAGGRLFSDDPAAAAYAFELITDQLVESTPLRDLALVSPVPGPTLGDRAFELITDQLVERTSTLLQDLALVSPVSPGPTLGDRDLAQVIAAGRPDAFTHMMEIISRMVDLKEAMLNKQVNSPQKVNMPTNAANVNAPNDLSMPQYKVANAASYYQTVTVVMALTQELTSSHGENVRLNVVASGAASILPVTR